MGSLRKQWVEIREIYRDGAAPQDHQQAIGKNQQEAISTLYLKGQGKQVFKEIWRAVDKASTREARPLTNCPFAAWLSGEGWMSHSFTFSSPTGASIDLTQPETTSEGGCMMQTQGQRAGWRRVDRESGEGK